MVGQNWDAAENSRKASKHIPNGLTEFRVQAVSAAKTGEIPDTILKEIASRAPEEIPLLKAMAVLVSDQRLGMIAVAEAFEALRTNPFVSQSLVALVFNSLRDLKYLSFPEESTRLIQSLEMPFGAYFMDARRQDLRWRIAVIMAEKNPKQFYEALDSFNTMPWEHNFLQTRYKTLRLLNSPMAQDAAADYHRYMEADNQPFFIGKPE